MSKSTENYKLIKPDLNESADINIINNNMDIIDKNLKESYNKIAILNGQGSLKEKTNKSDFDTYKGEVKSSLDDKVTKVFKYDESPGAPLEISQWIDFHNSGSKTDFDARIFWNGTDFYECIPNKGEFKILDQRDYDKLFQYVSSMKAKIASATTDKGVPTDANATGDVMAQNIRNIKTGYSAGETIQEKKIKVNPLSQYARVHRAGGLSNYLHVDKNGDWYTSYEEGGNRYYIDKISGGGQVWEYKISSYPRASGISTDSMLNVYYVRERTIYKLDKNGEKQWECYVGNELNDIAIDNLDNIYVVGSKLGLCKFNSLGEKLWRKNDFTAKRIIFDKNQYLYVNDGLNPMKINLDGDILWSCSPYGSIYGISVGRNFLYVIHGDKGDLAKISFDGETIWDKRYPVSVNSVSSYYDDSIYITSKNIIKKLDGGGNVIWEYTQVESYNITNIETIGGDFLYTFQDVFSYQLKLPSYQIIS